MAERYQEEYGKTDPGGGLGRQVWHTPTELFKVCPTCQSSRWNAELIGRQPHYAQALTSAIVASYKQNHFPHEDLVIYEVGAGNGSFMVDSLAYIRDVHPEVFERTRYKIVEISAALAAGQTKRAEAAGLGGHVEVLKSDFFKWEGGGEEPCYVVALEVMVSLLRCL